MKKQTLMQRYILALYIEQNRKKTVKQWRFKNGKTQNSIFFFFYLD